MKNICLRAFFIISFLGMLGPSALTAQMNGHTDSLQSYHAFQEKIKVSGVFYLAANYNKTPDINKFAFVIRRAYLTVIADLTKKLSVRYTQDITIDNEGNDAGNVELRIKYAYLQYKFSDFLFITNNKVRFGITQRPWIDYEEHINAYRVEGTMFMERSGIFNSSGFGINYEGYFGGKLSDTYIHRVNAHHPGKFGTFSVGIYNGGGYHNFENNYNKTIESRISVRLLPELLPGLQISYVGVYGKGNIDKSPDFIINSGYISYQNRFLTITAQYEKGLGNATGTYSDTSFNALPHHGYSLYSELRIPKTSLSFYGRYDHFTLQAGKTIYSKRYLIGAGWRFFKQNKVVFTYQEGTIFNDPESQFIDLALDISF